MLSGMAKAGARPELADEPVKVFEGGLATLLPSRRTNRAARVERPGYAANQPRRADRRPPNHHSGGAGKRKHGARVF